MYILFDIKLPFQKRKSPLLTNHIRTGFFELVAHFFYFFGESFHKTNNIFVHPFSLIIPLFHTNQLYFYIKNHIYLVMVHRFNETRSVLSVLLTAHFSFS